MSEVSNPINEKNKQIKIKKENKRSKNKNNNRRYSKCSHQFFNIVHAACCSD